MVGGLLCSLVLALSGNAAGVGKHMETTLQDDAIFLHRPGAVVRAQARRLARLGADRLRLTASWNALAPAPRSRRKPARPVRWQRPGDLPAGGWHRLDRAVEAGVAAGLQVQIDVAF